jgi:hypothetical protein
MSKQELLTLKRTFEIGSSLNPQSHKILSETAVSGNLYSTEGKEVKFILLTLPPRLFPFPITLATMAPHALPRNSTIPLSLFFSPHNQAIHSSAQTPQH